jgi:hypothetical protein
MKKMKKMKKMKMKVQRPTATGLTFFTHSKRLSKALERAAQTNVDEPVQ